MLIFGRLATDLADARLGRSLVQPRILLTNSSPRCAPEQQNFLQVLAVHDRANDQQRASGEHGDRPPPPGISADQSRPHADSPEGDQRLTELVRHGSRATAPLAQRASAPSLPGVERDRKTDERDQHTQDDRKLLQFHAFLQCKKGARWGGLTRPRPRGC
jgi:hypothetical protein